MRKSISINPLERKGDSFDSGLIVFILKWNLVFLIRIYKINSSNIHVFHELLNFHICFFSLRQLFFVIEQFINQILYFIFEIQLDLSLSFFTYRPLKFNIFYFILKFIIFIFEFAF